jgi:hypothetical protein
MGGYLDDLNMAFSQGWNKKKFEIHIMDKIFHTFDNAFPSQEPFYCFLARDTSPVSACI